MIDLKQLLTLAVQKEASDIHLKVGRPPCFRVMGILEPLGGYEVITREAAIDLVRRLLNPRQKEMLAKKSELDLSYGVEGLGRFRVAIFQQRGEFSFSLRLIPVKVPALEDLNLPPVLNEIAEAQRGLVLVTGVTGSGKSTTLAAMIRKINESRPCHIITIEDPIEFQFEDSRSIVSQREVSLDTADFSSALRAALRQDPDVIMVGEMRDSETVGIALQAAETGHLVLSTLHTTDSTETVNRVISMFPPHQQHDVRYRFASALLAVVSMRLIRSSFSERRLPAVEVLRNTDFVYTLLTDPERVKEIRDALVAGHKQYGTQTFDQSIFTHFQNDLITQEDALLYATSADDMKLRIAGIVSSSELV